MNKKKVYSFIINCLWLCGDPSTVPENLAHLDAYQTGDQEVSGLIPARFHGD